MPLIDCFGRVHNYLRISVTDRCNLRCVYCMPAAGVPWKPRSDLLSFDEILRVARIAVDLGIEKIRLTGGEPLVRSKLIGFIEKLAALPGLKTLAMTTNGTLLREKAHALRSAGLAAVNVSLDTLRAARFRQIALRDGLSDVLAGIQVALDAGFSSLKLNVVVMAGVNDDEILDFVEFARSRPVEVRFIEFMPFPGNPWHADRVVSCHDMQATIEEHYELTSLGDEGTVARRCRIAGIQGRISFISPLSEEFCSHCSRLRLTADGALKSCLFCPAEVSLRDALRAGASDDRLRSLVQEVLVRKRFTHPAAALLRTMEGRCMADIGG